MLAVYRGEHGVPLPPAQHEVQAGDVLVLAGSVDCVRAARDLARSGRDPGTDRRSQPR